MKRFSYTQVQSWLGSVGMTYHYSENHSESVTTITSNNTNGTCSSRILDEEYMMVMNLIMNHIQKMLLLHESNHTNNNNTTATTTTAMNKKKNASLDNRIDAKTKSVFGCVTVSDRLNKYKKQKTETTISTSISTPLIEKEGACLTAGQFLVRLNTNDISVQSIETLRYHCCCQYITDAIRRRCHYDTYQLEQERLKAMQDKRIRIDSSNSRNNPLIITSKNTISSSSSEVVGIYTKEKIKYKDTTSKLEDLSNNNQLITKIEMNKTDNIIATTNNIIIATRNNNIIATTNNNIISTTNNNIVVEEEEEEEIFFDLEDLISED